MSSQVLPKHESMVKMTKLPTRINREVCLRVKPSCHGQGQSRQTRRGTPPPFNKFNTSGKAHHRTAVGAKIGEGGRRHHLWQRSQRRCLGLRQLEVAAHAIPADRLAGISSKSLRRRPLQVQAPATVGLSRGTGVLLRICGQM